MLGMVQSHNALMEVAENEFGLCTRPSSLNEASREGLRGLALTKPRDLFSKGWRGFWERNERARG